MNIWLVNKTGQGHGITALAGGAVVGEATGSGIGRSADGQAAGCRAAGGQGRGGIATDAGLSRFGEAAVAPGSGL